MFSLAAGMLAGSIPWRAIGAALLLAAAGLALHHYGASRYKAGDASGYARGHAEAVDVQGRLDRERADLATKALTDEADQRKLEQERTRRAKENDDAHAHDLAAARAAAAGATDELGRLRAALATADAAGVHPGEAGADPGAGRGPDDAARLRELLGACSGRYADVAAAADALRTQVTGLQGYVKAACTAATTERTEP
jgi:hypothetical protein